MSVSLDSWDADFHDEMRGRKDSWKKAMQALEYIQEAGMDPYLNVTVGHYNAKSEDLKMLLDYSKKEISNSSKCCLSYRHVESGSRRCL